MKKEKAITLISLVVTIVILIILAGLAVKLSLRENGIFDRAREAKEETNKQAATETINLKITNFQMDKYAEEQRMPTLKELSLALGNDNEIQYVTEDSKLEKTGYSVESENPSSIYTKLNKYSYEFEINSSLEVVSINGVKVAAEDKKNSMENITIYANGVNTKSEAKKLPKGKYKLIYMSCSFSSYNCCPIIYVYKNQQCIITGQKIIYNTSTNWDAYSCTSDIVLFELEEEAEIQINISNGSYCPYAVAIIIPDNEQ